MFHIKQEVINDLRMIICLRKFEFSDERISVCNVTEKLAEQLCHALKPMTSEICYYGDLRIHIDVKLMSSRRHSAKVQNTTIGNSIFTMAIDL